MNYPDKNIPWVESPFFEQRLAESNLTDEQKNFVRSYSKNGYAIFDPQISDYLVHNVNTSMWFPEKGDRRVQDAWKYNQHVREVATLPKVLSIVEMLYQRKPIPFQTLNFCEGTQQDTHSDLVHFGSTPQRFMCGVWIALEDITDFNGPLHYYPGSHKLPFYDFNEIGLKGSAGGRERKRLMMDHGADYAHFVKSLIDILGLKKETLNIKKGQAIVWAANLLHGGNPILHSGSTRFSQVTHYYFEDCAYYVPRLSDLTIKKVFYPDLTNIATGEKVVSKYFGREVGPPISVVLKRKAVKAIKYIYQKVKNLK